MRQSLIFSLILVVCVVKVICYVQETYYITPTPSHLSSNKSSPCLNSSSHCSFMTLNELIRGKYLSTGSNSKRAGKRIFVLLQPGIHVINLTNMPKKVITFMTVTFKGNDNVTIYCKKSFVFHFTHVWFVEMSNIHFKNCCAEVYRSTLWFSAQSKNRDMSIKLYNIQITHTSCEGIRVNFKSSTRNQHLSLKNSILSTGSNGVNVYMSGRKQNGACTIRISNVIFNGSCLSLKQESKGNFYKYEYTVVNTTFFGCACSPALSIDGITDIEVSAITISTTQSQHFMQLTKRSHCIIRDRCRFYNNKGTVAINSSSKLVFLNTDVEFINNTVNDNIHQSAILYLERNSLVVFNNSCVIFKNNYGKLCGGIMASKSTSLLFTNSTANFIGNSGEQGGVISLHSMSVLIFVSDVHIMFSSNRAQIGGAIFINDSTYIFNHALQTSAITQVGPSVHILFMNNTAASAGSNIYGGWLDWTINKGQMTYNSSRLSNSFEFIGSDYGIASDPLRICMCINQQPDCNITNLTMSIYPGQTIEIPLVAVGQRYSPVVAHAAAEFINSANQLQSGNFKHKYEALQKTDKSCETLNYTVQSLNSEERILITVDKDPKFKTTYRTYKYSQLKEYPSKLQLLFTQFIIKVNLKDCPLSFSLDRAQYACVCPQSLRYLGLKCDYNEYKIIKSEQQWVGITYERTTLDENPGVIAHPHCPHDYCMRSDKVQLEHEYEVCAFNRSGILCGGCQPNYSRVVGSSKCKQCSDIMLLVIIPSGLLAGWFLIIFLMVLNLTVSVGTINGLMFYANIIRAQQSIFFTKDTSNSFLSKFIALLNLDQGIESCLYNGFDSYAETWLQFCFPLYIWLLVTTIIVSSHYSTRISKLSGRNSVQVLATLLLLSYTKVLRLIIDVISFTTISYPDGYTKEVWLYDGNVDFLRGKHIPLFLSTLLLLVLLSFPYTLSLISIQWLLKISHFRVMFWVRRLKPLFDAYTGPFKANHRYWTGLLLIVRIMLLTIFSLNRSNDPAVNLLCIIVFLVILLAWLYVSGWIYESMLNNFLELTFLLNLTLTSAAALFELSNQKHSPTVIYTSTGIAFMVFVGIVIYHAQRQLRLTVKGAKLTSKLTKLLCSKKDEDVEEVQLQCKLESPPQVMCTVVELTQPLLEEEEENDKEL